jgi:hypothetical protein
MKFSRRRAGPVILMASLAVLSSTPPAQSVIPPLLIEIGFRILELLSQHIDKRGSVDWNTETTQKLNELISMSAGIADELQQINITIKKEVRAAFSDFVENYLKADISQVEDHLPELQTYQQQNRDARQRMNNLIDRLESHIDLSLAYGAVAYETTYAAIIVQRALFKYADVDHETQKRFFKRVAVNFGGWLAEAKELKHKEQVQIEGDRTKVSDIKAKYKGYFEILGDFDKGFTANKLYTIPRPFAGSPKEELDEVQSDYGKRTTTEAGLDKVVSQLERCHASLLEVSKGGRMAL